MSQTPLPPRLDGLMDLARREGVDVRPTLLRVLTDLYVQTARHTDDEDRQFSELFSRLIALVDDATIAAVRARLAVYPATPHAVRRRLETLPSVATATPKPYAAPVPEILPQHVPPLAPETVDPMHPVQLESAPSVVPQAEERASADLPTVDAEPPTVTEAPARSPQQQRGLDAQSVVEYFFGASAANREKILDNLEYSAFSPATPPEARRAARANEALERAALARNASAFTMELASALTLPVATAQRIVKDGGGEALIVALKTLAMPQEAFQRVLLFLDPTVGTSVPEVYRRSHLYAATSLRPALMMLAIWRLAAPAAGQGAYRPALYDDERRRARNASAAAPQRPEARPADGRPSGLPLRVNR